MINSEEFDKKTTEYNENQTEYLQFIQLYLVSIFKPLFDKHKHITAISWNQGFSTYNDNTYDYNPIDNHIKINWNNDKESLEFFKLLDININDITNYYYINSNSTNEEIDEVLTKLRIKEEFGQIVNIIESIPDNILVSLFGQNMTITVNKDGIHTDMYYDET